MVFKLNDDSIHICLNKEDVLNLIDQELGGEVSSYIKEYIKELKSDYLILRKNNTNLKEELTEVKNKLEDITTYLDDLNIY